MFTFPSLEWFQELVRLMNDNEVPYRRLGYADVNWAIEMQPSQPDQLTHLFVFEFEEYGCKSVKVCDADSQPEVAFTMRATLGAWEEMIRNIQENQGPDLQHTLNYLTLPDDPIYIDGPDFLSRDLFARYGQTFQLFFNGAIQVPTTFSG
jgi:hypothetical protein